MGREGTFRPQHQAETQSTHLFQACAWLSGAGCLPLGSGMWLFSCTPGITRVAPGLAGLCGVGANFRVLAVLVSGLLSVHYLATQAISLFLKGLTICSSQVTLGAAHGCLCPHSRLVVTVTVLRKFHLSFGPALLLHWGQAALAQGSILRELLSLEGALKALLSPLPFVPVVLFPPKKLDVTSPALQRC